MENEISAEELINSLVEKAHKAQQEFESFSQEQTDAIVKEIGKVVYDRAEELARMTVDETKMGVYEDKVAKCHGKSKCIWNSLKGKKSVGIIEENKETGIIKVAKAKGVVGAVTPVTNPVVTPMCNIMFAIKGQNAIIIAPHPRAEHVNKYVVDLFREILKKHNAPVDLIQTIEKSSIDATNELMKKVDVVVATGGGGMVKAAYSSGHPALGVGPGNVQVIMDRGIDYEDAVKKIIIGRTFDNGIICAFTSQYFYYSNKPYSFQKKILIKFLTCLEKTAYLLLKMNHQLRNLLIQSSLKTVQSIEKLLVNLFKQLQNLLMLKFRKVQE